MGNANLAVTNTALTTFTGGISGGAVTFSGAAGIVQLQGTNTYTGGTTITNGSLILPNAAVLSSGPLALAGGSLFVTVPTIINNNVVLNGGTTIISGTNALTLTGPVTLVAASQLTVNDTAGLTITGTITEAGGARNITDRRHRHADPAERQQLVGQHHAQRRGGHRRRHPRRRQQCQRRQRGADDQLLRRTGGTFTLTFDSQTTAAIAWSSTLTTLQGNIQAALGALSGVGGVNNILVGGTSASITVTFQNALGGTPWNTMTFNGAGLAGGTITSIVPTVTGIAARWPVPGYWCAASHRRAFQANNPLTLPNPVSFNGTAVPVAFTGSAITFTGGSVTANAATAGTPLLLLNNTTTFTGTIPRPWWGP